MKSVVLHLSVFGRHVAVVCTNDLVYSILFTCYGHLTVEPSDSPEVSYTVGQQQDRHDFFISRVGASIVATTVSDFIFIFEKDLTIELQHQRPDLYFIHAAAVESDGRSAILTAASGTGKSTTTYGLLHQGFRYLSDELAPIDLKAMTVHPYPHALCLKSEPPDPYVLPAETLRTEATLHVPVTALPASACTTPVKLGAVFFLDRDGQGDTTVLRIDSGEAAARLYANALNNLAHGGEGLDAAIQLTSRVPCFRLHMTDLSGAGAVIRSALKATL